MLPIQKNKFIIILFLLFVTFQSSGCEFINRILYAIQDSSFSGKSLNIIVLPPLRKGSNNFSWNSTNRKLHRMLIDGITNADQNYNYSINAYECNNTETITSLYSSLNSARSVSERKGFLDDLCQVTGKNQIMFARYDRSGSHVGLKIYLYDKDENTLGKEPANSLNWIKWTYEYDAMDQVTIQIRDLIRRYFSG